MALMRQLTTMAVSLVVACGGTDAKPGSPRAAEVSARAEPATEVPSAPRPAAALPPAGRYMCQVELAARWRDEYPCEVIAEGGQLLFLGSDMFSPEFVAGGVLRPGEAGAVELSGSIYFGDSSPDSTKVVRATLRKVDDGWLGEVVGEEPELGWQTKLRLAIRPKPWPPGCEGQM
jgi:hypothetical protein